MAEPVDIAIVGMAGLFPKAPNTDVFWSNILNKVDATGDPPADWLGEPKLFDPAASPDEMRLYTMRGGFLGDLARFDPRPFGAMPIAIVGGEPDQFLALKCAQAALEDAGLGANVLISSNKIMLNPLSVSGSQGLNIAAGTRVIGESGSVGTLIVAAAFTVIGLGSIGQAIARRVLAFGMEAMGYDVRTVPAGQLPGVRQVAFEVVLRESDVLFLACNLTAENRHLLNAAAFAAMKPGMFLVNVSRGPLIDEAALAAALGSGKVAGAGLDVFEQEPLLAESPLRRFDQCVFTAHAGSSTEEAIARINQMTSDILFHVLGLKPALSFMPNRLA